MNNFGEDLKRQENLSDKQINILNSELRNQRKSVGIAYLLYIFFGAIGVHQFYLGKWKRGLLYLILTISGWFMGGLGFISAGSYNNSASGGQFILGFIMLVIVGIFLLIDLFTIPKQVRKLHNNLKNKIISEFES